MTEQPRDSWSLVYEGFDPREEGLREALCTLGNGYMATRGAAPDSVADGVHYPGTYAAGCYNRLETEIAGQTIVNESLVNAPNWLALTFAIDDGPWFALAAVDLLDYRQELDLRRGVLIRRLRFRDDSGHTTRLVERRLVHMEHEHLAALETTLVAEDWSGKVRVRSALDGTVENAGVARYRDLASRHLEPVDTEADDDTILLRVETNQSHVRIAEAARTRVRRRGADGLDGLDGLDVAIDRTVHQDAAWIAHELSLDVGEGDEVTVEKVVAVYTSRDHAISEPGRAASAAARRADGFEDLLARHVLAWGHLWDRFRLEWDAEDDALRAVRLHQFHLLQTVSPGSIDLDVGVPPRGLHGEAYRGLIMWDELFAFPILNLRLPVLTRALLGYRYRRLPAARRAARDAGFAGAMFPWQSGSDGEEMAQQLHLNPESGRWVDDPTDLQRHIGLAVAYNVWTYYQATGDTEFLADYGAEIILEIARFFGGITTYDRGRDRYEICGVLGPDEFHTGYPGAQEPGLDNNAYTNVMAAWLFQRACELPDLLKADRRDELTDALGLTRGETERWSEISRKMFVPFHGDGVISQFEGYGDLDEFDWDAYRERYGDSHRLDRILEAEDDSPNRYKVSKQADALMLFYVLTADELGELFDRLGYRLDPDMIPRTIEYYLERTSHGSTLSAVVHAWVLARAHRDQAMEFFVRALDSDIADVQGGTTAEGIHLGAMAGTIDLLQRCFTGLDTRGGVLWLNPFWPTDLGPLEFDVDYRSHLLTLRLTRERIRVSSRAGQPGVVRVGCGAEVVELAAGDAVEFVH
jgi:trehalose 6-phosphate phosphatase